MAAGVRARGIGHRYQATSGPLTVLDDVDLDVAPGEHVAVVGRSGSGKSTLLSLLGGLEPPQVGHLSVGGHDLEALAGDDLAAFRRETVGFVFQHFGLLEALTAEENVELAGTLSRTGRAARRRRARDLLGAVGLADRLDHRPAALSGGERQRVAMARALANEPELVLADEPTGNLDDESAAVVGDLLARLPGEHGCTVIVVAHDDALARGADRRLALRDGRLERRIPA
ncbi:ABC transporter ATP-binding protein [soil metagenome]